MVAHLAIIHSVPIVIGARVHLVKDVEQGGVSIRARRLVTSAIVVCVLGWPSTAASAQQPAPAGLRASDADRTPNSRVPHVAGRTLGGLDTVVSSQSAAPLADGERATRVGHGAVIGAVLGGLLGFVLDQNDHSGEGFGAAVMMGGGAVVSALSGALIGLLSSLHRTPPPNEPLHQSGAQSIGLWARSLSRPVEGFPILGRPPAGELRR